MSAIIPPHLKIPDLEEMLESSWISPQLRAAIEHSLKSRGSGFRSQLVLSICRAYSMEPDRAAALSTALEYFHLASLLLDDLPCMDDADTRRGLPCTHRVFGESMTILSSLAFINKAYFLIWEAMRGATVQVQEAGNALLDECLGLNGIINGQALDLKFGLADRSPAMIERIALGKTGSLLKLSLVLPAIVGKEYPDVCQLLSELSDKWGCIYQLIDDFKDIEWGENNSGKTPLRDVQLNRPNLVLSLGRDEAIKRLHGHFSASRMILDKMGDNKKLSAALHPFQQQLEHAGEALLGEYAA